MNHIRTVLARGRRPANVVPDDNTWFYAGVAIFSAIVGVNLYLAKTVNDSERRTKQITNCMYSPRGNYDVDMETLYQYRDLPEYPSLVLEFQRAIFKKASLTPSLFREAVVRDLIRNKDAFYDFLVENFVETQILKSLGDATMLRFLQSSEVETFLGKKLVIQDKRCQELIHIVSDDVRTCLETMYNIEPKPLTREQQLDLAYKHASIYWFQQRNIDIIEYSRGRSMLYEHCRVVCEDDGYGGGMTCTGTGEPEDVCMAKRGTFHWGTKKWDIHMEDERV